MIGRAEIFSLSDEFLKADSSPRRPIDPLDRADDPRCSDNSDGVPSNVILRILPDLSRGGKKKTYPLAVSIRRV